MSVKLYELICGEPFSSAAENIRFDGDYDLIVAGLGGAGHSLAVRTAKDGHRVLGIERGAVIGGMSVLGMINGYYMGYSGDRIDRINDDINETIGKPYSRFVNHPDSKSVRIGREVKSSGLEYFTNSIIVGVYADGNTVIGVRALIEGGIKNYSCKFLSDSTSDGHVLRILGVKGTYGRPTDGKTVPFTSWRICRGDDGRVFSHNTDSGYIDPYNDASFTNSCIVAHGKHLKELRSENSRFLCVASLIGNREGMLIEGEQTVTLDDVLSEREYKNTLICAWSDIDKHGQDRAFDGKTYQDWRVISNLSTVSLKIRIPLGTVVPKGYKGLLSVSRCLGVDSYVSSAVRMTRDMFRLGEAVGIAVSKALDIHTNDILTVPFSDIIKTVKAEGCYDRFSDIAKAFVISNIRFEYVPFEWMTDENEIKEALNTDTPGIAIWSCYRQSDKFADRLAEFMTSKQVVLRYNSAIALGLIGDERSIPNLREIVKRRSPYFYTDCRRSNQLRSAIAICLLGRFGDVEIADELISMFSDAEYERKMYHIFTEKSYLLSINEGFNEVYYQHLSFAEVALTEIAKKHPEIKEKAVSAFKSAFCDDRIQKRISSLPAGTTYDLDARHLKEFALSFSS